MKSNANLVDNSIREIITSHLGQKESKDILDAMETYMLQNNVITAPPLVGDGQTKGDWRINLTMPDGQKQDIRPDDALSYIIIKEMLKSGPIRFALEMKRAQMVSVFRNRRSVSVQCEDQELAKVGEFVVEHILPFAAFEFTWSALVYGAAFMEGVWETKSLSQIGLKGDKLYTIPKQLNLVPHQTIRHIRRTNQGDFDGFVQMADYKLGTYYIITTPNIQAQAPGDVVVEAESALVIPYNGFSRNLWGESFLYPLYPLWFWYEIIIRSLVRYSELMGDPPRIGKAPSKKKILLDPSDPNSTIAAIDYLLAIGVNLSKSNCVVIPSDPDEHGNPEWSLDYMVAPDRSQPFVQILEMFNSMILRAALTGDRTYSQVQGQGVPSAIGQIGAEATALHNEMVVSSWLHYLNMYWFGKISKYNLGPEGVPAWLEIQGLDPKEREFLIAISGIAGNSSTFQEFFYLVDWESLGRMAGLPMFTKEQAEQIKDELAKKEQDRSVEESRIQTDLDIENQKKQRSAFPEQFQQPNGKEPSNLEVQLKLEELASGKVPLLFLTQEEIKDFQPKETATQQNFFIPSKQDEDLALALAIAYKYKTIQLFNPYHDSQGRFASVGKAGASAIKRVGINKDTAMAAAIGAIAPYKAYQKLKPSNPLEVEKMLIAKAEYKKKYDSLGPAQKLVAAPAEFISRKKGLLPKASRLAIEVGPDVAFSMTIGAGIFSKASLLGGAATAATLTALFGAAPTAAVVLGGLVIGASAAVIASELVDYGGTRLTRAYMDRYAPKDNYHVGFTKASSSKKSWKAFKIANNIYSSALGVGMYVAYEGFGSYLGLPITGVAGDLARLETEDYPDDIHEFLASIEPYIAGMIMGQVFEIKIPFDNQLQYIPGFVPTSDSLILTPDTLPDFVEAYLEGNIPAIRTIEFGDISVTQLEENEETIQLFNDAHDKLGRFAPKQAAKFISGLDSKREVNLNQAQKITNKTIKDVSKKLDSGLVDGFQTKLCNDWQCMKKETGISNNALGAYYNGKLVMSPHGLAYSTYNDKKFYNRVVAHETVHARKRSQGKGITLRNQAQVDLEEGCTEMISMGFNKYPYQKSPYIKQMRSVAKAARNGSGGDTAKAWQIISKMHYYNDTDRGLSAFAAYSKGRGTDADIEWLMGSMSTRLEVEDDEKEFEKSEKEIYKTIRKVQKTTFNSEPKPFIEDEL